MGLEGMTSTFGTNANKLLLIAFGKVLDKVMKTAYEHERQTVEVCLLPMHQLHGKARDIEILPDLETRLFSVSKLLDEEYTTVFYPQTRESWCMVLDVSTLLLQ